jgi:hypothetical protein
MQKRALERFQEKCAAVFRPEPRQNKELEHFCDSTKRENALALFAAACVCALACAAQAKPSGPPDPYREKTCALACCHWGKWAATKPAALLDKPNGRAVAAVAVGAKVTGLEGLSISHPVAMRSSTDIFDTPIRRGDEFYVLGYRGRQLNGAWFKGKDYTIPYESLRLPSGKFADSKDEWWLKLRTAKGVVGWVKFDDQFGGIRDCR